MIDARGFVYKITNNVNGKVYIGITKSSIIKRWNVHVCNSVNRIKKSYLNRAIVKYGKNNFSIEKVKTCFSDYQLYNSEIYFISLYKANNRLYGYNNSTGGEKSTIGSTRNENTKKRISEFQKNRLRKPHSIETKEKIGNSNRGKKNFHIGIINSALKRKGKPAYNRRPIYKLSKDGVILDKYNSLLSAANAHNVSSTAILNALQHKSKSSGGFKWEYEQKN